MQNNHLVETLIGALVVAIAAGFLIFAYSSTSSGSLSGYTLEARFASADGITPGTDVRLHGVKIGSVSNVSLDPKTFLAVVRLTIRNDVQIPDDSAIKVTSAGLLGNPYLSVQPGGSTTNLRANAQIANTQGSVDIMGLIGRAIYGNTSSGGGGGAPGGQQPKPSTGGQQPKPSPQGHP